MALTHFIKNKVTVSRETIIKNINKSFIFKMKSVIILMLYFEVKRGDIYGQGYSNSEPKGRCW